MKLLLDEMFPPQAASLLRDDHDHVADHVRDLGLGGADDQVVARHARENGYALVTENIADFAHEPDLVLVCVLKRNLPAGDAQAPTLAKLLRRWQQMNPEPYVGQHWPR